MQCRRCGMENMPGLSNCMRCNSVLTVAAVGPTYPPRAGWTFCLRPLFYRFNRLVPVASSSKREKVHSAFVQALYDTPNLLWMVLSIVPGLGHLVSGRLWRVRWFLPGWFLALAVGVLSLGSGWAGMLIGLAIGLHTWIILDAGRVSGLFADMRTQVIVSLLLFILLSYGVYSQPRRYVDLVAANVDIPAFRIAKTDMLVIRKGITPASLRRGDLVIYQMGNGHGGEGAGHWYIHGGDVPGRILAFEGEKVTSDHGVLTVVGADSVTHTFESPVPVAGDFSVEVPADRVLCYPVVGLMGGNANMPANDVVRLTSLPPPKNVFARVVMKSKGFMQLLRVPYEPLVPLDSSEPKEAPTP